MTAAVVAFVALIAGNIALFAVYLEQMREAWFTVTDNMYQKIVEFGESVGESIGFLKNTIVAWFNGIAEIARSFMYIIEGIFQTLGALVTGQWSKMWEGLKTALAGFCDMAISILRTFANMAIGIINDIIEGFNRLFGLDFSKIPVIPDSSIVKEWQNMKKPTIVVNSGMATGGTISNGSALVGEAGAEILTVSNGSATVTPLGGHNGDTGVVDLLQTYLPYLAAGNTIVMDSGALVGSIAPDMNLALGTIATRGGHR